MPRLLVVWLACAVFAANARAQPSSTLSFEEALGAAERAAEAMAIARSQVDRAEAGVASAKSGYWPTVNGSAAYQRTLKTEFEGISFTPPGSEPVELPFGQPNNWRLGLQVTQPLFDGFRTQAAVTQAR